MPSKVEAARAGKVAGKSAPAAEKTVVTPPHVQGGRSGLGLGIAAAAVVLIGAAILYFGFLNKTPEAATPTPAPPVAENPSPTPVPPPAAPASPPKAQEPTKVADSQTKPAAEPLKPAVAEQKAAEPADNLTSPPATTPVPPPAAEVEPRQGGARRGGPAPLVAALQARVQRLSMRANAANQAAPNFLANLPQNPQGRGMRQTLNATREEFFRLMKEGTTALNSGDLQTANQDLDLADKEMTKIETAIRRGTAPRRQ